MISIASASRRWARAPRRSGTVAVVVIRGVTATARVIKTRHGNVCRTSRTTREIANHNRLRGTAAAATT